MCGILGIISPDNNKALVEEAMARLAHRGPDARGFYTNQNVFLGHVRLAIQDLTEAGAQPMTSDEGRYTLVFNGEIYNHLELRKKFTFGESYNGHSDTETILRAWEKHGTSILTHLNGIFALAIYDKEKNSLILARDRFGTKPLYYFHNQTTFAFASELKSIKDIPGLDKSIDYAALADYLTLLYSTGSKTPFLYVKRLLPGTYIELNLSTNQLSEPCSYIEKDFMQEASFQTESKWKEVLEYKLYTAVERQLLSDVPVAYFLSGGLDSSAIVAMARKQLGKNPIDTFTLDSAGLSQQDGFAEDLGYAKRVASHLNVNLNVIPTSSDLLENFEQMVWQLDEPMADAAALNVEIICKAARQSGYKVLLSGTGADELFGGYRRHQALGLESPLAYTPSLIKKGLGKLGGMLPTNKPLFRRGSKLLNTFALNKEDRLISYHDWLKYDSVLSLFKQDISESLKQQYHPHTFFKKICVDGKNDLEKMLLWERMTYLPDDCLLYTDKMSMLHGVEVRVPFLDNELVDFSAIIPSMLKIKNNTTKYLLKKVMEEYLPKEVIYRPKTGFGAPVRKWVTQDLNNRVKDYLSEESINRRGIFNQSAITKLISDNKSGKIDASYTIWALLAIEVWMRQFAD